MAPGTAGVFVGELLQRHLVVGQPAATNDVARAIVELREVEPDLLDLVRSLKGSRWQLFTKIQLPGALPYVFAGMKVAAILAVAGAVVGVSVVFWTVGALVGMGARLAWGLKPTRSHSH